MEKYFNTGFFKDKDGKVIKTPIMPEHSGAGKEKIVTNDYYIPVMGSTLHGYSEKIKCLVMLKTEKLVLLDRVRTHWADGHVGDWMWSSGMGDDTYKWYSIL